MAQSTAIDLSDAAASVGALLKMLRKGEMTAPQGVVDRLEGAYLTLTALAVSATCFEADPHAEGFPQRVEALVVGLSRRASRIRNARIHYAWALEPENRQTRFRGPRALGEGGAREA